MIPSQRITTKGVIELFEAGAGAPVVLVHASGMGAKRWNRVFATWRDKFRLLAPNLLGYGASGPFDEATWTVEDEVALIGEMLDMAAQPVHLVGHSFGGGCALRAALRWPEKVATLSLYEPTVFSLVRARGDRPARAELRRFDHSDYLDPKRAGEDEWLATFVDYWSQAAFWDVMLPVQRDALRAVGRKVFAEVRSLLTEPEEMIAQFAAVDRPTLVLHGDRTTAAGRCMSRQLAELLPDVELVMIERAGHLAPLVRVAPVCAAIEAFIKRRG
ncbi:MAG: alpha/beta hydrolase [Myxococcales bacterium]|nr:alpha/beta hydrolase [Myxococcales bacterium]